jgi:peptidoglycan hydrolase CwlO-like protein
MANSKKHSFVVKTFFYTVFFVFAVFILLSGVKSIFAQEIKGEDVLKAELEKIEKEIQQEEGKLQVQKQQSNTIQGKVNELKTEINKAEKVISLKNQLITTIGTDIALKDQTVEQLNDKLERSKEKLSLLLRTANKYDSISLPEIIIQYDNISEFFEIIDTISIVQNSLDKLFDEIRQLRGLTEEEKAKLEEKKIKEANAKAEVEREKQQVAVKKSEQDSLLAVSKNVEKTYEQVLAEKRQKAAAIRSALFRLRDSTGISFGEALDLATKAGKLTGVRPAFILAILKQESNIGQNVGSCVISDLTTGATQGVNTGKVFSNGIHPTRDLQLLQTIVTTLGRDPLNTRVSCPLSYGYGGAMGPSQFIPSTWKSYIPSLQGMFGTYPDPWNPEHAITATGLLVRDLGAGAQTYTAERTAALKYYAGGNWSLPQNQFYGNQVMAHAAEFQKNIDFLADVQ